MLSKHLRITKYQAFLKLDVYQIIVEMLKADIEQTSLELKIFDIIWEQEFVQHYGQKDNFARFQRKKTYKNVEMGENNLPPLAS